jgi:hypothetical protein
LHFSDLRKTWYFLHPWWPNSNKKLLPYAVPVYSTCSTCKQNSEKSALGQKSQSKIAKKKYFEVEKLEAK